MPKPSGFTKELIANDQLSLVHFKTEWSGASQIISIMYEDLESSYHGIVNFYTVDFEKEKAIGNEYGITEIPAILFFRSGQLVDHVIGLISKNTLITKIESAIPTLQNI